MTGHIEDKADVLPEPTVRTTGSGIADQDRDSLCRRALDLEYFTVLYNIAEGLVSVWAGAAAGSIALIGFGLDSFIESFSGGILIWRLRRSSGDDQREKELERKAVKLVACSFFLLAAYVAYEAVEKLYGGIRPEGSLIGVVITLISILIMRSLAKKKLELGKRIGSRALVADAMETVACIAFSVTLIVGLGLNLLLGWWWADPAVSLVIAALLLHEGAEFWREEEMELEGVG